VLHEIDAALRTMLLAELPATTTIRFDTPDPSWCEGAGGVVSAFLHRVREDLGARTASWVEHRDERGRVVDRAAPARRYHVHYVVTAWCADSGHEHQLLGAVLAALAGHDTVPEQHLSGSLRAAGHPVTLAVAHPELSRPAPELWRDLALRPRAALDLVATAILTPATPTDLAPPAQRVDLTVAGGTPATPAARPRDRALPHTVRELPQPEASDGHARRQTR
jgi:hypothetical protein